MGVHGLWGLLEPSATSFRLEHLEGKRLAIDLSIWLCQATNAHLGLDQRSPHLALLVSRIAKLLYYKVRPVFVFDGDSVPVFKQQVKRDRQLRGYLNEMVVSKPQKEALKRIAESQSTQLDDSGYAESEVPALSTNNASIHLNSRTTASEDIFTLSERARSASLCPLPDESPSSPIPNFLDGYDELITADGRLTFLREAKERAKQSRLALHQLPEDSDEFSNFQLRRLLRRNDINSQLDKLRREKLEQYVNVHERGNGQLKLFARDQTRRGHLLLTNKKEQPTTSEVAATCEDSMCWPQFLGCKQSKNGPAADYNQTSKNHRTKGVGLENKLLEESSNGAVAHNTVEEDPALQQAILDSIEEQYLAMNGEESGEESSLVEPTLLPSSCHAHLYEEASVDIMADSWSSSTSDSESGRSTPHAQQLDTTSAEEYFPKRKTAPEPTQSSKENVSRIYEECQHLLSLLGIPYMFAPGEAEAQCARLEQLRLVDGVISDDSDVWLFGAHTVYRNMFSRSTNPEEYKLEAIRSTLGLSRKQFIQLGMLAGGDYTRGLENVGMVIALEVLAEFQPPEGVGGPSEDLMDGLETLVEIRGWLREENPEKIKNTEHRRKLGKLIRERNDAARLKQFPNVDVYKAYAEPLVDEFGEKFEWKRVDFSGLSEFLWEKLGLDPERVQKITNGAFNRWDAFVEQAVREYQLRITSFLAKPHGDGKYKPHNELPSKRVKLAIAKLKSRKCSGTTSKPGLNKQEEKRESTTKREKVTKAVTTNMRTAAAERKPKHKPSVKKS